MKQYASLEEIVEDVKQGLSFEEICDKYGYSHKQTVSNRLRKNGYSIRSSITKNEASYKDGRYAGLISIPWSILDELGVVDRDALFYDLEKINEDGERGVKILFRDSRVYREED